MSKYDYLFSDETFFQQWENNNQNQVITELKPEELHYFVFCAEPLSENEIQEINQASLVNENLIKIAKKDHDNYFTPLSPGKLIRSRHFSQPEKEALKKLAKEEDFTEIERDSFFYCIVKGSQIGEIDSEKKEQFYKICFCYCHYLTEEQGKEASKVELKFLAEVLRKKITYQLTSQNWTKRLNAINFHHPNNKPLFCSIINNNLVNSTKQCQIEKLKTFSSKDIVEYFEKNFDNGDKKSFSENLYEKLNNMDLLTKYFIAFDNFSKDKPEVIKCSTKGKENMTLGNREQRFTIRREYSSDNTEIYTLNQIIFQDPESGKDCQKLIQEKINITTEAFMISKKFQQECEKYFNPINNNGNKKNIKPSVIDSGFNESYTILSTPPDPNESKKNPTFPRATNTNIHTDNNIGEKNSLLKRIITKEGEKWQNCFIIPGLKIRFKNLNGVLINMMSNIPHGGKMQSVNEIGKHHDKISKEELEKELKSKNLSDDDIIILLENIDNFPSVTVSARAIVKTCVQPVIFIKRPPLLFHFQ